jgi:3-hydroxyacyl-CoA dehydrogenase
MTLVPKGCPGREAVKLVEQGVATPADIDAACRLGLGHPIGPFALMDAVTSSLCVQTQEIMQGAYGERFRPPAPLKQRVGGRPVRSDVGARLARRPT